jgi:S1-C subfamily serine protease
VRGDLLDLILVALAAAFAVAGYRQGFIIGVLSFAGFAGGAAISIYLAPGLARALTANQSTQAALAIIFVFAAAVGGMLVASALGVMLRSRVRGRPSTILDSIGGAVVNVVGILLLAWLIGTLVAYAPPFPGLAYQVNNSVLLRGVDRLIPQDARPEFTALRRLLTTPPYVQVFGALGAETALGVPAPGDVVHATPGFLKDMNSVVKIQGLAESCSRNIEGSGFVIGKDKVVTNAHVVAGVTDPPLVTTRLGEQRSGRVVLFDAERDVAVLYVPDLNLPTLHVTDSAPFAAKAIVAGYPLDAGFTAVNARVGSAEEANGPDIYDRSYVTRDIYPIRADVRPGNSGGPLISPSGDVYGMVFAAAVYLHHTGYALTGSEIKPDISQGLKNFHRVSTDQCQ